jgi:hypothetical protein
LDQASTNLGWTGVVHTRATSSRRTSDTVSGSRSSPLALARGELAARYVVNAHKAADGFVEGTWVT